MIPLQLDPTTTTPDMLTLFQMILALTTELRQACQDLVDLQKQLKERPRTQSPAPTTIGDAAFPALPAVETLPAPSLPTPQPKLSYAQVASTNREKRKAIAARFFQAPSANQGFQFVYMPTKAQIPLGKLRTLFKEAEINNGRLLDVHYPERNIVAALVHNDYAPELKASLTKIGINLDPPYDPLVLQALSRTRLTLIVL